MDDRSTQNSFDCILVNVVQAFSNKTSNRHFLDSLTAEQKLELGTPNKEWFNTLTSKQKGVEKDLQFHHINATSRKGQLPAAEESLVEERPAVSVCIQAHGILDETKQISPAKALSASCISPATPGPGGITPGQLTSVKSGAPGVTPRIQTASTSAIPPVVTPAIPPVFTPGLPPAVTPVCYTPYAPIESCSGDTSLLKYLLRTPATASSHRCLISASLGVDLNASGFSWTSSLASPAGACWSSEKKSDNAQPANSMKGAARILFSPDMLNRSQDELDVIGDLNNTIEEEGAIDDSSACAADAGTPHPEGAPTVDTADNMSTKHVELPREVLSSTNHIVNNKKRKVEHSNIVLSNVLSQKRVTEGVLSPDCSDACKEVISLFSSSPKERRGTKRSAPKRRKRPKAIESQEESFIISTPVLRSQVKRRRLSGSQKGQDNFVEDVLSDLRTPSSQPLYDNKVKPTDENHIQSTELKATLPKGCESVAEKVIGTTKAFSGSISCVLDCASVNHSQDSSCADVEFTQVSPCSITAMCSAADVSSSQHSKHGLTQDELTCQNTQVHSTNICTQVSPHSTSVCTLDSSHGTNVKSPISSHGVRSSVSSLSTNVSTPVSSLATNTSTLVSHHSANVNTPVFNGTSVSTPAFNTGNVTAPIPHQDTSVILGSPDNTKIIVSDSDNVIPRTLLNSSYVTTPGSHDDGGERAVGSPDCVGVFTQISPGSLAGLFQAVDEIESSVHETKAPVSTASTHTPLKWHSSNAPSNKLIINRVQKGAGKSSPRVDQRTNNVESRSSLSHNHSSHTSMEQGDRIARGRSRRSRLQMFSYPTNSQILESCPEKVFTLKSPPKESAMHQFDVTNDDRKGELGGKTEYTEVPTHVSSQDSGKQDSRPGALCFDSTADSSNAISKSYEQLLGISDKPQEMYSNPVKAPIVSANLSDPQVCAPLGQQVPARENNCNASIKTDGFGAVITISKHKVNDIPYDASKLSVLSSEVTGQCVGFQNASGKPVAISDTALHNATKLLHDIEISPRLCHEASEDKPQESVPSRISSGFQSASGKLISVSEVAKKKAEDMMTDIIDQNDIFEDTCGVKGAMLLESYNQPPEDSDRLSSAPCPPFDLTKHSNEASMHPETRDKHQHEPIDIRSCSFQCASGKAITVSDRAKQRAEKLLSEIPTSNVIKANSVSADKQFGAPPSGFQMASGKSITVSEEATNRAQQLMREVSMENMSGQLSNSRSFDVPGEKPHPISDNTTFLGFQCASGKSIAITEEAKQQAKRLMSEIQDTGESDTSLQGVDKTQPLHNQSGVASFGSTSAQGSGFLSASGNPIQVSCASREKAAKLCEELSGNLQEVVGQSDFKGSNYDQTDRIKMSVRKDFNQLPQGFRPFKPPRPSIKKHEIEEAVKEVPQVPSSTCSGSPREPHAVENNDVADKAVTDKHEVRQRPSSDMFDDDLCGLSCTQVAEVAGAAETLMHHGLVDDVFTQFSPRKTNSLEKKAIEVITDLKPVEVHRVSKPHETTGCAHQDSFHPLADVSARSIELEASTETVNTDKSSAAANPKKCVFPNTQHLLQHIALSDLTESQFPDAQNETDSAAGGNAQIGNDNPCDEHDAGSSGAKSDTLEAPQVMLTDDLNASPVEDKASELNEYDKGNACNSDCQRDDQTADYDKDEVIVDEDDEESEAASMLLSCRSQSVASLEQQAECVKLMQMSFSGLDDDLLAGMECEDGHTQHKQSCKDVNVSGEGFDTKGALWNDECDALDDELVAAVSSQKHLSNGQFQNIFDKVNQIDTFEQSKCLLSESYKENSEFLTASGRNVDVSKDSLEKAKSLLTDKDDSSFGFQTASGRNVGVSKDSLEKAKSLSSDKDNSGFGFQTASGRSVGVSKDSLEKAKSLLSDKDDDGFGFQTASGRNVDVSKDSLEKAKSLLSDKDDDGFGFQTASGRNVGVSKDSLEKAKSLFSDKDDGSFGFQTASGRNVGVSKDSLENAKSVPSEKVDGSFGFQTASGRNVGVSKDPLEKTRSLLSDKDDGSFGFQTSSGRNVGVSKDSLEKVKILLSDKDDGGFGFQTASGRNVGVSKDSLEKAETLFSDKDDSGFGFQTASGISVGVSKDSLEKAKSLFSDKDDSGFGFQTASGRNVGVSKDSLEKAKSLLSDKDDDGFGFQTASGRNVGVSKDSLEKAKSLFSDKDDGSFRFQTASGRNVGVSKDSLEKAKSLLSDKDDSGFGFQTASGLSVGVSKDSLEKTRSLLSDKDDGGFGFQTASGGNVGVSQDSLEKAKILLSDKDDGGFGFQTSSGRNVGVSKDSLEKAKSLFSDKDDSGFGFQTASGRNVGVSKDSLVKAKSLFSDKDDSGFGFQTASGRNVGVSKDSLEKAKSLFSDKDDGSFGFQTASGRNVGVSKDSLEKAKSLFSDKDDSGFGFQTASGRNVGVSKDSLEKAKSLLSDKDDGGFGFQTASGRNVGVSKDSLEKAKSLLSDKDDSGFGFQTASGLSVGVSKDSLEKAKSLLSDKDDSGFGFQTASGRNVGVSKDSLEKAKSLFSDKDYSGFGFQTASGISVGVSKDSLEKAKSLFSDKDDSGFGFQTASGRNVGVSKGSLEKAKSLFSDKDDGGFGFQTASGRNVGVSKDSLEKAKSLFSDKDDGGFGFQTASGRNVGVSKDSLEKAKSLLSDKDDGIYGFQTASGRNVGVSKDSLEKTRSLLSDEDADSFWPQTTNRRNLANEEKAVGGRVSVVKPDKLVLINKLPCMLPAASCSVKIPHGGNDLSIPAVPEDLTTVSSKAPYKKPFYTSPEGLLQDRRVPLMPMVSHCNSPQLPSAHGEHQHGKVQTLADDSPYQKNQLRNILEINQSNSDLKSPSKSKPSSFSTPYKALSKSPDRKKTDVSANKFVSPFKKSDQSSTEDAKLTSFKTPMKSQNSHVSSLVRCDNDGGKEKISGSDKTCSEKPTQCNGDGSIPLLICDSGVIKLRARARLAQANRISSKRRAANTQPCAGWLWRNRQAGVKTPLKTAVQNAAPQASDPDTLRMLGVGTAVLEVSSSNAAEFRFNAVDCYGHQMATSSDSVSVGDGAVVVWDEQGRAGKEEFCNGLLDSKGVEPSLITREWVYNHYRWIVWKLAATEVAFPHQFAGRLLTPDNVMYQLKYRYDREIDLSHRSALKKIYERDDTPQKTLVLCVSAIITSPSVITSNSGAENKTETQSCSVRLELTDGWYAILACLDGPLRCLVQAGRIRVGDKLITTGAEILGSQEAATPLEGYSNCSLKLCANSTRRARWFTRLGYYPTSHPPCLSLSSLYTDGGTAAAADVMVTRVYPIQCMEKLADGSTVFRCERAEQQEAEKHAKAQTQQLDQLYAAMQKELELKLETVARPFVGRPRRFTSQEISQLTTGPELYTAFTHATDPAQLESYLTETQLGTLHNHRRRLQEEHQADIMADFQQRLNQVKHEGVGQRSVTPLLKVRLAGCHSRDLDTSAEAMLTVWRPSDEVQQLLREGSRFKIYNLTAGEVRGAQNTCKLSLTANRSTRYVNVPADDNFTDLVYEPREVVLFSELVSTYRPRHQEVDVVGLVVRVSAPARDNNRDRQTVYLLDGKLDIAAVKFWSSNKNLSHTDLLHPGAVIAGSNLQWRQEISSDIPVVVAMETSTFSHHPHLRHLKQAMSQLETLLAKDRVAVMRKAQMKLHNLLTSAKRHLQTATPFSLNTNYGQSSHSNVGSNHKRANHHSVSTSKQATPESRSTNAASSTQLAPSNASPAWIKQRQLQKCKLSKLEIYGEPIPLPALSSPLPASVKKNFCPPRSRRSLGARRSMVGEKPSVKKDVLHSSKLDLQQGLGVRDAYAIKTVGIVKDVNEETCVDKDDYTDPADVAAGKSNDAAGKSVDAAGKSVDAAGKSVDEVGKSIDAAGKSVDEVGKSIDAAGKSVDEVGKSIDAAGKSVDEVGKSIDAAGKSVDCMKH